MSDIYNEGHCQLQDKFDKRLLADRFDDAIVQDCILPRDRDFIERMDMFFIGTVDERDYVNGMNLTMLYPQDEAGAALAFRADKGMHHARPGWKKGEWVVDALPADDPAVDGSRKVIDR